MGTYRVIHRRQNTEQTHRYRTSRCSKSEMWKTLYVEISGVFNVRLKPRAAI